MAPLQNALDTIGLFVFSVLVTRGMKSHRKFDLEVGVQGRGWR